MTQRWEYSTKFAVYGTRFLVRDKRIIGGSKKLSPEGEFYATDISATLADSQMSANDSWISTGISHLGATRSMGILA
jgi:hypothetical protein